MAAARLNENIRYEPDEQCTLFEAVAVGAQGVLIVVAPAVLIVAITAVASGQDERYLTWAVFASLIIGGAVTALQAAGIGWLGARHILITGTTPNYVAVSVLALQAGGPRNAGKSHCAFCNLLFGNRGVAAPLAPDHYAGRLGHSAHVDRDHDIARRV